MAFPNEENATSSEALEPEILDDDLESSLEDFLNEAQAATTANASANAGSQAGQKQDAPETAKSAPAPEAANASNAEQAEKSSSTSEESEKTEDASSSQESSSEDANEWRDKYMRLHAEWDTYRRRQKEQAELNKALAAEKMVNNLIPVIDDLERSIEYAQKNGESGLLGGVEAVLAKFVDTLQKDGVEVINPQGEAFDALEAQAVGTVDDASQPDETVADVYQKGYKIGNKVLRPAMVTVTTGGPKRETTEE